VSTSISQLDEGRVTVQDFPPGLRTILTDLVEEFIKLVSKLITRLDGEGVIERLEGADGAGGWKYSSTSGLDTPPEFTDTVENVYLVLRTTFFIIQTLLKGSTEQLLFPGDKVTTNSSTDSDLGSAITLTTTSSRLLVINRFVGDNGTANGTRPGVSDD
jgi:hypothetical protein